jgi:saccharopine dehydrogenase (NAD+, L-lysine-forming)
MSATIWLRHETKENEKRTPLTPSNAKKLIEAGVKVYVEKSPVRIFADSDYEAVGCQLKETNSWITEAPTTADTFILGLKELEEETFPLKHQHIYFAHIYKGQEGAKEVFKRYEDGQGHLYDLEFLLNEQGRRVSAFGFWAGYIGCALAVETYAHQMKDLGACPLRFFSNKEEWTSIIKEKLNGIEIPKTIIIGALGRCGTGARTLLSDVGLESTPWDFEETKKGGPFSEILEHDIFVNTVLMTKKIPPFLNKDLLKENKSLKIVSDVSCDPNSDLNPIPIYDQHTTWEAPLLDSEGVSVIAIDNLPSALPKESSEDFSDQLIPHLINLCKDRDSYTWKNAKEIFEENKKEYIK